MIPLPEAVPKHIDPTQKVQKVNLMVLTRNKKLLGAPGHTTRNKDTTRNKGHRYEQSKDALRLEAVASSRKLKEAQTSLSACPMLRQPAL